MRLRVLGVLAPFVAALAFASSAAAAGSSFNGNCQFSGPIQPMPPITILPKPNPHFSYHGTSTCSGTLNGAAVTSVPSSVELNNVSTLFDTCELGPDVGLHGTLSVGSAQFPIVINMIRVALVGPFLLTTNGGGLAIGLATFTPPDAVTALQQCVGSGVPLATLSGSFSTLLPLAGA